MNDPVVTYLETVVKGLVDHPEDVKVTKTVDEMGVLMTLDVNQIDMGQIIGRKGATAKAIRTLLRVAGMKNNARVNMKINEPMGRPAPMSLSPMSPSASDMDDAINDLKADLE